MRSKLFQTVRTIHDLTKDMSRNDLLNQKEDIKALVEKFSTLSSDVHDQNIIDYTDFVTYGDTLSSLVCLYITTAIDEPMQRILMAIKLRTLREDPTIDVFIAYAMKIAVILYRSEELAQKVQASEGLNWVVAPDQQTQPDHPNSDQPAPQHGEPPSTSSQSDPSPSQDSPEM